jgi:hypothetical protein
MSLVSHSGSLTYDYLQIHLGVSLLNLWSYPSSGPAIHPSSANPSPHYSWGVVLQCHICKYSWLVCRECSNVRSYFCNAGDCIAHHRRKHRDSSTKAVVAHNVPQLLPFNEASSGDELIPFSGVLPSLELGDLVVPASPPPCNRSLVQRDDCALVLHI